MDALADPHGKVTVAIGKLTRSLGFLTRVVHIQINDRLRAQGGLAASPATLAMLTLVHENPGIRQAHAARFLLIHDSNMAMLVKNLVAQGLIERRGSTGKRSGLWITEKGAELVAGTSPVEGLVRAYAGSLSDQEYRQLIALLERLYRDWV